MSEYDTFWVRTFWTGRKSGKAHWCTFCTRKILPGERYQQGVNFAGQTPAHPKQCAHCQYFYALCPAVLTDYEGHYVPVYEWDHDVPAGWADAITAWQNLWRTPDGALFDPTTLPQLPHKGAGQ